MGGARETDLSLDAEWMLVRFLPKLRLFSTRRMLASHSLMAGSEEGVAINHALGLVDKSNMPQRSAS